MAGVIRGVVRAPIASARLDPSLRAYAGQASALPNPRGAVRGAPGDAVIYLDRVPAHVETALAAKRSAPRLAQREQAFVPRVLPVAVGTTVEFPNEDPIYHNVFSVSPARRFDLGKYPRGQSKRVTFSKAGVVNVYCDIHSNMEAWVMVLPHHAFTQPEASGAFRLPELPPGSYLVRVWHPDFPEQQREVTVPESGDITVDFEF